MFPGVNGFHWSPIHIVFLTIFGLVLTTVGVTLILALYRTIRDMRLGKADGIRWHQDFEDLPANERSCRHALMGSAPGRICPRALDCRGCPDHAGFAALESQQPAEVACALDYPAQRYYHRGHTWVEPLADGTLAIGLDDLGNSHRGLGRSCGPAKDRRQTIAERNCLDNGCWPAANAAAGSD